MSRVEWARHCYFYRRGATIGDDFTDWRGSRILGRAAQYDPQLEAQPLACHVENVARRFAGWLPQVLIGRPAYIENLVSGIDQHRCRIVLLEQSGIDQFCISLATHAHATRRWECLTAHRGCGKPIARHGRYDDRTALVDSPGPRNFLKLAGIWIGALGSPQKQIALRVKRKVKHLEHTLLRFRLQVDKQVSAADQVDAGKRRIGNEVLWCKQDLFAQGLIDLIAIAVCTEKALESRLTHG